MTSRERLGIMGGSNGGLLMGAVLTQRPDIAAAVVCAVPVLDMLRSELTPNGALQRDRVRHASATPTMFRALYAYSPYHNVVDGTAYPPVLFTAGEFDPRVEAYHAKKMVARLQAATSSDQPILLRMESGGHGIGQSLDQLVGLSHRLLHVLLRPAGFGLRRRRRVKTPGRRAHMSSVSLATPAGPCLGEPFAGVVQACGSGMSGRDPRRVQRHPVATP